MYQHMHYALLTAFLDHYMNIAHSLPMNYTQILICKRDTDSFPRNQEVAKGKTADEKARDAREAARTAAGWAQVGQCGCRPWYKKS